MKARHCCDSVCDQGRSCPQRIPTVRPASAKASDWLERYWWLVAGGIVVLVVLVNLPW